MGTASRLVLAVAAVGATGLGCDTGPLTADAPIEECAAGTRWIGGDAESPLMLPGSDCIGCHDREGAPRYVVAGTVFDALDAADDCFGVAGAEVEIEDADGTIHRATTNDAGNFYIGASRKVVTPYVARIVIGDRVREKRIEQSNTNCATCHTAVGEDGAPGRITAP